MAATETAEIEGLMDSMAKEMGRKLEPISIDYKKAWKSRVVDRLGEMTAADYRRARRNLKARYRPKYREAIAEVMRKYAAKAYNLARQHNPFIARHTGGEIDPSEVTNPPNFSEEIVVAIDSLADQIVNRETGNFDEQTEDKFGTSEGAGEASNRDVDRLSLPTLEEIGEEGNTIAVDQGRGAAAEEAADQSDRDVVKMTRREVLDDNTCDECERLAGTTVVVGSDKYHKIRPPHGCEGRHKCRGWMELEDSANEQAEEADDDDEPFETMDIRDIRNADPEQLVEKPVKLFELGEHHHPKGNFTVDDGFFAELKAAHDHVVEEHDYYPTVKGQHADDGTVRGELRSVMMKDDGVYGGLYWIPQVADAIEEGKVNYISPSFKKGFKCYCGETFDLYLNEISHVSEPHIKGLPTLQEQYELSDSTDCNEVITMPAENDDQTQNADDDTTESAEDGGEGTENMPDGLNKRLERIEAMLEQAVGGTENAEDDTDNAPGDGMGGGGLPAPPGEVAKKASKGLDVYADRDLEVAEDNMKAAQKVADGEPPPAEVKDTYVSTARDLLSADEAAYDEEGELTDHGVRLMLHGGPEAAGYLDKLESAEASETDNADDGDSTDNEGGGETVENMALRTQLVEYELSAAGVEAGEERIERLAEAHARDPELYEEFVDTVSEATENGSIDEPVGSPGTPNTGSDAQKVIRNAANEGVENGSELLNHLRSKGMTIGEDFTQEDINEVYGEEE